MPDEGIAIFCDESHPVKRDGVSFFVIGCVYCFPSDLSAINRRIDEIKSEYGYKNDYEAKWSTIKGNNLGLAKALISYAASDPRLRFRILVATNKDEANFKMALEHEDFYERMYVLLVKKIFVLRDTLKLSKASLFIDRRNTHSKEEALRICKDVFYSHETNLTKFNYDIVDSSKVQMIQLVDILIGAFSYERLGLKTSEYKLEAAKWIRGEFHLNKLNSTTDLSEEKLNVFVWRGAPSWNALE